MVTDPLFVSSESNIAELTIEFEGEPLVVPSGISVAAALLISGISTFRTTPVGGSARGPFCMMGVCFECLVEIDGKSARQSCMVQVYDGMSVRRQVGAAEVEIVEVGSLS